MSAFKELQSKLANADGSPVVLSWELTKNLLSEATVAGNEIERLTTEVQELKAEAAADWEAYKISKDTWTAEVSRLTGALETIATRADKHERIAGSGDELFVDGLRSAARIASSTLSKGSLIAAASTPSGRERFFVEQSKGWYWVTERETKHNYAQTETKEKAEQICRDLNNGITKFERDGFPVDSRQGE